MNSVPTPVNEVVQALVNLLAYLLPIVLPVIFARVGVWVKARLEDIKRSQPEYVQRLIEAAASFGADFAEKIGPGMKLAGKEKMDAALDAARNWLEAQGYQVNDELLRAAIEVVLFGHPERYQSSKG